MAIGIVLGITYTIIVCLVLVIVQKNSNHATEVKELKKEIEQREERIFYAIQRLDEVTEELKNLKAAIPDSINSVLEKHHNQNVKYIDKIRDDEHEFNRITLEIFLRTFDKNVTTEEEKARFDFTYTNAIEFLRKIYSLEK